MGAKEIISCLLFIILGNIKCIAQIDEVRRLWSQQIDTNRVYPLKPAYLHVETDKVIELYNTQPNFGMYKDNYFITGVPIDESVNNRNADAKFQILPPGQKNMYLF